MSESESNHNRAIENDEKRDPHIHIYKRKTETESNQEGKQRPGTRRLSYILQTFLSQLSSHLPHG